MTRKIIAIDGPAASGKGTLSRNLATHLNFAHMDTGALYRAVALRVLHKDEDPITAVTNFTAHFAPKDLTNPALRHDETGIEAAKISAIPEIRAALLALQRDFAANPPAPYKGAVLDGRDIGTIICPDAPVKLYITASDDIRAQRRTKELQSRGLPATYGAVLKDMRERDTRDQSRKAAPLKPADDALTIDTSALTETQVFEKAMEFVKSRLLK